MYTDKGMVCSVSTGLAAVDGLMFLLHQQEDFGGVQSHGIKASPIRQFLVRSFCKSTVVSRQGCTAGMAAVPAAPTGSFWRHQALGVRSFH